MEIIWQYIYLKVSVCASIIDECHPATKSGFLLNNPVISRTDGNRFLSLNTQR